MQLNIYKSITLKSISNFKQKIKNYFLKNNFLKSLIISIIVFSFSIPLNATVYYVSNSTGNDLNSGTSISLPWKTLTKVNSITPKAGDQILFKKGDSWAGTITVKASGTASSPIVYGAWGDGANPVISGFTTISGWTNEGNGIWSKAITVESNPEIVTINDVQYAMGRIPNADRNNPRYSDYYHIDSYSGTTSITDSECNAALIDWDGAEIVIRSSNDHDWIRGLISNHSGTKIEFNNPYNNSNAAGFGYFIQNDLRTLDQFGEWYYGGGRFYMHFGIKTPTDYTVKVSTKDKLIDVNKRSFVTVKNIKLEGANNAAITTNYSSGSYNLTVDNCHFDFNYTSIYGHSAPNMTITNCNIMRSSDKGIYNHWNSDGTYIANNTVDSTSLVIGAFNGELSTGSGCGIVATYSKLVLSNKKAIVEKNVIKNNGHTAIMFSGDSMTLNNNFIDKFCINRSDGGGLYHGNQAVHSKMTIDNNIVLNGIQNNEIYGLPLDKVSNKQYNIYLDYYSTGGFTITDNTAAYCRGGAGIMLHGNQNVVLKNNTVYDCAIGVRLQELDGWGSPPRNITLDKNIVFAKTLSQLCVLVRSTTNDFNQYGLFSNNYYAKPIDNTNAFATLVNTWVNTYHNLASWQSYTSLDASSQMSVQTIKNENDLQFELNASGSPKTVSLNFPMIDAKGIKYSSSLTLQPYSSAVLMKDQNPVLAELTKPVITAFSIPGNYSSLTVPINKFTVVYNKAVTGYILTETASAPLASDAGWSATTPASYTFSSLGTKTLYAWAKDAAGNVSAGVNAQVEIQKMLGFPEVYASSTTIVPRMAMPVTFTEAGEINSITIYHNGGTGYLIMGVYSDQNNAPSSRLGLTASTTINTTAGWQTVPLVSPVSVSSGQTVWLAWVFEKNPGVRYTTGTPGRATSTSYWPLELPETFGTSNISNSKFSIYCNYLPKDPTDITKPVVTAFNVPASSSSLIVAVTSFTATDNKVVSGYLITETATAPLVSNAGWSASAPTSYTFTSQGTKTLYAWAKDINGNVSLSLNKQVIINITDNTKPIVSSFTIPVTSSSLTVAVTGFTATDNNAVSGYMITESSTAPQASNVGWSASPPASYTFISEGTKTLYAWAKDAAGNISASLTAQVIITLALNTEIVGNSDVYSNTVKWGNQLAMPVIFTNAGEIKSITIYHEGGIGNLLLGVYSDQNGYPSARLGLTASTTVNQSAGWQTVQLSSNVPVISGQKVWLSWVFQNSTGIRYTSGSQGRAASTNTWVNGMPITFGTSTIASTVYSIYCNFSSQTNNNDATAPVVTAFAVPATSASLTVAVTGFTATDNKGVTGYLITESASAPLASNAGWSASTPATYTFATEGSKTLYAWAKDAAGNVSLGVSAQVIINNPDVTKPVVTAFAVPATSASLTVTVKGFSATDNKSITGYLITESATTPQASNAGWSASPPASYTFISEGTKTLYAWAKDAAGNVSASLSAQVNITLPVFSVGNNEIYNSTITWGNQLAMPVTFSTAGEIKSISIYHEGGTGNFLLGVYSDLGDLPSSRLGITPSTAVNPTAGWQTVLLSSPVTVTSGQTVWLSWVFQNTPVLRYTTGSPGRAASSYTWVNGMPVSFGPSTIAPSKYSIYCIYSSQTTPVDNAAPVIGTFNIPTSYSGLSVPVNSFTVNDNIGVTGYLITESATAPLASNSAWMTSAPTSYSFASEGTKTLYAWAKDAAGNVSASLSAQVNITLPVFSVGNTDVYGSTIAWVNQLAMPVTFTEAGEIKSIAIYHEGGTGNLLLGVYSDVDGFPSSRLAITVSTPINSVAGWQTVQLTGNVPVASGQTVWLSWVFQNNPGIRYATGSPGRAASTYTWANGMPLSFGTSTIANTLYSIYCNYIVYPSALKNAGLPYIIANNPVEDILNNSINSEKNSLAVENNINDTETFDFKIYPNPAKNYINVESLNIIGNGTKFYLIDSNGRTVVNMSLNSSSELIDVSKFNSGIYFVKLFNNHGSLTKKFIIEKN